MELPPGDYDAAVFENLFPTFAMSASDAPDLSRETRPALGVCEVVVFTQDPSQSLAELPLDHTSNWNISTLTDAGFWNT